MTEQRPYKRIGKSVRFFNYIYFRFLVYKEGFSRILSNILNE